MLEGHALGIGCGGFGSGMSQRCRTAGWESAMQSDVGALGPFWFTFAVVVREVQASWVLHMVGLRG